MYKKLTSRFFYPLSKFIFILFLIFYSGIANSQTCTQSNSVSGDDCDNFLTTVTINCAPPGATITNIQITGTIGPNCYSWYEYDINLGGNWFYSYCNGTNNFSILNGSVANGTVISLRSWDNDAWCDAVTLGLTVVVSYSCPTPPAPTTVGWTATGGSLAVPACGTNSATVCAGSGVGVQASLVQGVNYTVENLGTTACGTAMTNAYLQAWSPGGSTCGLLNPIGTAGLNAVTFNAPVTGNHQINVTSNRCGSSANICGAGFGHDFTGNSAVLRYRQNTTVNNTTSTANICLSGTKSLTATLGGAHNNPTVVWSVVSGLGTISGTTFTPSGIGPVVVNATVGNCSSSVNFDVISSITPTFNSVAPICAGDPLSALPTTSLNGIAGSWSPGLDNSQTTVYTFTPDAGQCASTATMTITVNNSTIPTFTAVSAICAGDALAPLPTTSTNGITGSWSPALDNSQTTVYTFTPDAGQCASTATMTITVNNSTIPTFTAVSAICAGDALAPLPTTSTNGITGSWSPALDNSQTTLYTFTPNAGQCASTATMTITVNNSTTPTFTSVSAICAGDALAPLPTTSTNGITGSWSPALDNSQTTLYTFTPNAGQCASTATMTITVNNSTTPTFTSVSAICAGDALAPLPTTSTNGITGSWSPALDNSQTTLYTFTPNAGQCASTATMTITVNNITIPTFTSVSAICAGDALAPLPTTSTNGITGSWSPALDNSQTTLYTFTPNAGQCASTATMTITVNNSTTPTFTSVSAICAGDALAPLPTTSTNGITGSWSPALDNSQTTLYTFTPNAGQCASTATMTITVTNNVTPVFTPVADVCEGSAIAPLPTSSTNGVTGAWSPALDNSQTTVYTFTPNAGQCALTATMTITVTNNVTPVFTPVADVCEGSAIAPLPTSSTNGVTGAWSPALDNTQTTLYTFTPNAGQCATSASLTITIIEDNLAVTSDVASVCPSETATITATGATSYIWSPATGLNQTTGSVVEATPLSTHTYTVVGTFNGCAFSENITITIKSIPTITAGPVGATLCAGNSISLSATGGVVYVWLPTAASGSTVSVSPLTTTVYTVLGTALNGCVGQTTLTVNVTTPPAATIAYAGSPFCSSIATAQSVTRTGTSGGVYSSTAGLSIDPSTGAINPSLSTPGNYVVTYTIAASGGCPVYTTTANITISPAPTGSFSYAGTPFCGDLSTSQPVTFTGTSGGTFSAPAGLTIDGITGEVIPSSSTSGTYTVTYSIPAGSGCPAFSTTSTVTISTPPTGTLSYAGTPFCTSLSAPQAVTFVGTSGGTYSSTAGLTINPTTGAITPSSSTPGSYVVTYTIAAANGCPTFTATTSVQINALPTASIAYAGSPFCGNLNTNQSVTLTGTSGGVFSAPAGVSVDASTGTVLPISSTPGTYTVTYTIPAANACPQVTATTSVTISTPPTGTLSYAGTPFCTSLSAPQAVTFVGTSGGTYSSTAGLTINPTTGAITPSSSTPGSYVVTYTIPAANGCPIFTATTSVQINALPTASIAYAGSPFCGNLNTNQSVTLTGTSGGVFSAPAGVSVDASTGSVLPISSTPGTYTVTYTIPAANACPQVTATTSVSITSPPSASISYTSPVFCVGAIGSQLVTLIGNVGGTYSSTAGLTINATTGAITPSTSSVGTYTVSYTLPAGGGCPVFVATTNVEIIPIPTATISYSGSPYCASTAGSQIVTLVGTSGGTYSSNAGLSIDATTGSITPTASSPGTYTVTYTIAAAGGCGVVTATASVQINPAPSATISYVGSPFCSSAVGSQVVTRTGTTGGTYSSTVGLTINPTTGAITPSTSTPGTYTVTYTVAAAGGCPVYTTTTTVVITALPTATISYAGSPYCASTAGSQTVTLVGTSGGTYSSTAGLSIDATTGSITPTASSPGTYTVTYTIAAAGGCGAVTATASVQINPAPSATISYVGSPFCSSAVGSQAVTRTGTTGGTYSSTVGLTINPTTGAITPSTSTPGTYTVTYTVAAAGGCPVYTTTTTVVITALPTATISYIGSPFCSSTAGSQTVTLVGTSGGTYSSTAGLSIDATTGSITPTASSPGTYTVTYTIAAAGGCGVVTATASVQINPAPSATISYVGSPFCSSAVGSQAVTRTGTAGGTYSSTVGLTINPTTGAITPSTSTPGTYTVTYTVAAAGGCPVYTTTTTVVITALPTATISYSGSPYCASTAGSQTVTLVGTSGGTYSSTAGLSIDATTGSITPITSSPGTYTVTYTIAAAGGCGVVTATASVQINPAPSATISYFGSPFCSSAVGSQAVTRTGTTGGTYSSTVGLTINPTTGAITPSTSTPGTYTVTYTVAAAGGCPVYTTTTTVVITALPTATISYAGSPFCGDLVTNQSVTLSGATGGSFSSTAGLAINSTTGDINPALSIPATHTVTYTIAAAGGCGVVTATTNVIVSPALGATISYNGSPFCSSLNSPQNVSLVGTSGGVFSSTVGLTLNSTTGAITPSTSVPGTYTVTYTLAGTGGCATVSTTAIVVITQAPQALINYPSSPYCVLLAGDQPVNLTGDTGGIFSSGVGLSLNSITGSIDPSLSTPNTYTVTYTIPAANGCSALVTTAEVTITSAIAPTIDYGATQFCSVISTVQVPTITGTMGGTFSAVPVGLSIDPTTGAIVPSTSTAGIYTVNYNLNFTGCSALNTSISLEIVTSPVVTIAYAGSYCTSLSTPQTPVISGVGNISGGVFTAVPAGLNINSTTGAITPSGSADGNYVVTYTVPAGSGCGAATGTFNVSIISPLTAVISYASQSFCSDVTGQQVVTFSGATGGTFTTSSGLTLDVLTGTILPSTSSPGTYTVTYITPATGSCPPGSASTTVAILAAPDVNPIADVTFCDQTYTLPVITGSNLTGNEAYFTGINGTGLAYNAGDIITTTQQLFIYDVNGVCSDEETFVVTLNQTPLITSPGDQIACGSFALPTISGSNLSGNENYYNNSQVLNGTPITGPITETQIVWIYDANGSCSDEVSFLVIVNTAPDASFTASNYCGGVGVAPTVTGETGGVFSLSPPPTDGATIDPTTGLISNGVLGSSYTIVYTVNGSCTVSSSQIVSFNTVPVAPLLPSDTVYCSNDLNTPIAAIPQSSGTISWFDDAALSNQVASGTSFVPSNTVGVTTYYVTETVNGCSSLAATINITVNSSPPAPAVGPNTVYCYGDSLNLMQANGLAGSVYSWYLDASLTNNVGTGDSIKPLYLNGATTYFVTQTATNGCSSQAATVVITIDDCFEINVPSAFTPGDGDNVNETWVIDQLNERFPTCTVSVFNRWGQVIFESTGYASPWNGTYNGELVPVASYYYIIEYNDAAKTPSKTGTVTIIRN